MVFLSENAVLGDSGNNLLVGTSEQDLIFGLAGLDSVFGAESGDILFGGSGEDIISGHQGADTLYGGQDNDLLYGGAGKDFLFGDKGRDTLYGDRGIDCLTGGAGADLFVVGDGSGGPTEEDVILDFNFVEDQIEIKDGLTFDDLLIEDNPVGENTVIRRRDTEVILAVLPGVEAADLTAANFLAEDTATDEATDETTGEAISRSDSDPINPEPDVTPVPTPTPSPTPTPTPEPDPVDLTPEPEPDPEPEPIDQTDTIAPEIQISLQNDTGINGDLITADPSISGTITDENPITAVTVGLDDTPVAEFTDILDRLNENQQFVLTPAILEEINGSPLSEGEYTIKLTATDAVGNSSEVIEFSFTLDSTELAAKAVEVSPSNGEEMVALTRETIVRFGQKVDPETVTPESLYLIANGEQIPGRIVVSSTEEFATFFYDEPLPQSTEVRVVVEGDQILLADGTALDADNDGASGGTLTADFRTLPLTQIEGTDVFGYVYDAYNTNPDGSNIPLEGVVIRLDSLPDVFAVTDENGYFILEDVPAPEFYVYIDGSEVENTPPGTQYASLGKAFHSVPGEAIQLEMDGEPFDIYLPPMAASDVVELSATTSTEVGFGTASLALLQEQFPDVDPAVWQQTQVTFPAGSAQDDQGNAATQAMIVPVDPNRLPAPLPPNVDPGLVISIQAGSEAGFNRETEGGATNFDVPAPVTFPNLEGLAPGEKSLIWSFNHDAGDWEVIGTGTVSEDGLSIVSDEGVGILAPGWSLFSSGSPTNSEAPRQPNINNTNEEENSNGNNSHCDITDGVTAATSIAGSPIGPPAGGATYGFIDTVSQLTIGQLSNINEAFEQTNRGEIVDAEKIQRRSKELFDEAARGAESSIDSFVNPIPTLPDCINDRLGIEEGTRIIRFFSTDIPKDEFSEPILLELQEIEMISNVHDAVKEYSVAYLGDESWIRATSTSELRANLAIVDAISNATDISTPGGSDIVEEERSSILNLPRSSTIDQQKIELLIERFDRTVNYYELGIITSDDVPTGQSRDFIDLQSLQQATLSLDSILMEESEAGFSFLYERLDQFKVDWNENYGAFLQENTSPVQKSLLVKLEIEDEFEIHTRTNIFGQLTNLILPPNRQITVTWVDPDRLTIAETQTVSGDSGETIELPPSIFDVSDSPDTDNDGLTDEIEDVIGTSLVSSDTDGDGINDLAEIQQGLDPLGGQGFPTGVIASIPLEGEAREIIIENSSNTETQNVYIATGSYGLAIVDTSEFNNPIVLGQLDLEGNATDIAVDSELQIAVVATGNAGLQLVDISDPMLPTLTQTLEMTTNQLEVVDGIVYAAVGNTLQATDLATGAELQTLTLPGVGTVTDIASEGTTLYTFTSGSDTFTTIDVSNPGEAAVVGNLNVSVASSDVGVFAGNGVAYLAGSGLRTIDVSDPNTPNLISDADFFFTARDVAVNGSGLALVAAEGQGLGVYDVTDPQNTNDFLTQIDTPGSAVDVAIASGIAYVADGSAGLQVINYRAFDNQGQAPTVTIDSLVPDFDTNTSGIQVIEGTTIPILTTVTDDVQVRDVELLVNGEVVERDISFPFDFSVPTFDLDSNTVEVQVQATDTGGNSAVSNVLSFGIVEDTFAPEIVSTNPLDNGVSVNLSEITIDFNEDIDPDQINLAGITLTNLGDDTNIPIESVESPFSNDLVINLASSLEEGDYQLTVDPSIIVDNAGNILESEISLTFTNNGDPGEEFADALDIGVLGENQIFEEFVGTDDRRDFYEFTIDEISQVNLNLSGLEDPAQLFIAADLNENGVFDNNEGIEGDGVIDYSDSIEERGITRTLTPGTYWMGVFTYDIGDNTSYTLSASATAVESTTTSPEFEPGEDLDTALEIGTLAELQTFEEAVGSLDRNDYYQFTIDEISQVNLNLSGLEDPAQLFIAADLNENGVFDNNEGIEGDGVIDYSDSIEERGITRTLTPGTYWMGVFTYDIGDNTSYTLSASATAVESTTTSPEFEPGEDLDTALEIGTLAELQTFEEAVGSLDRNDYYQFTIDEISQVNLNLSGLEDPAQLFIAADLNENGVFDNNEGIEGDGVLDNSDSIDERGITRTLTPGTYWMGVFTYDIGDNTAYTLSASATAVESTTTSPEFEPGEDLDTALEIGTLAELQTFEEAVGSLDRNDYYQFTIDEISQVNLNLSGLEDPAQLFIAADLNENGVFDNNEGIEGDGVLDNSDSIDERGITRTLTPGTYWMGVFTYDIGDNTAYTLSASATAVESTTTSPEFEPGEDLDTALEIGTLAELQTFEEAVGSLDRNDYYQFTIDEISQVNLNLSGLEDPAQLFIAADLNENGVFDNNEGIEGDGVIDNSDSIEERSILTQLDPGTYFIGIFTYDIGDNTRYTLTASAS